jgi:hypothetical protein
MTRRKKQACALRGTALLTFHDFLKQEYARVLQKNLLAIAIQEFKRQLGGLIRMRFDLGLYAL